MTNPQYNLQKRRAKIVCTIGPATRSENIVSEMLENGMNVARLNFSHGGPSEQTPVINTLRSVSEKLEKPLAILQDLQGPRIRLGNIESGSVAVKKGDSLILTTRYAPGNETEISVSYHDLPKDCKAGDRILLDDGLVQLQVEKTTATDVHTVALVDSVLRPHKGMNLPGVDISTPSLSEKDRADVAWGIQNNVDFIALSFVRNAADIIELRELLEDAHPAPKIIAKIEKPEAIENLNEILQVSDGVMVARGDLGVEVGVDAVPLLQKEIIAKANAAGKYVITATQMLESMVNNPTPTRAEASDVANAVLDGTDAVMMSAETAIGKFPIRSLQTMAKIVEEVEANSEKSWYIRRQLDIIEGDFSDIICQAAAQAVIGSKARCIVAFTETGDTVRRLSKFHPSVPLYAFTCNPPVIRELQLAYGVSAFIVERVLSTDKMLLQVEDKLSELGLADPGDAVIIALGVPIAQRGYTNLLKLHRMGEQDI